MRRSLFIKLFTIIAAILTFSFVVLIGTTVLALSSEREQESLKRLESEATAISEALNRLNSPSDYSDEIRRMAEAFSNVDGSAVFFANQSGYVFVCSDTANDIECPHRMKMIDPSILSDVKSNKIFIDTETFDGIYDSKHYTVGKPIVLKDGMANETVFISMQVESKLNYAIEILRASAIPCIIALCIMFIVVFFVTGSTVKPIKEISEAIKLMANGDFTMRVSEKRNDEIGDLAKCFNKMAESLNSLETMRNSFVTNVSHDLKTPMTSIGGFVDGILDGTIPPEQHKKYLTIVSAEIRRLSSTVNTMLNLSKIESGMAQLNYTRINLFDLVCRVVISFEQMLVDKNIDVLGLDNANGIIVECDESMIYQAVYNLIDNAVKFTQRGGYISIDFSENNFAVELYIKNSGDGISQADISHIFERFYKTDKSRSVDKFGAGIGLHIVKTIVDKHNGDIKVKSIEGQYTQFCLKLPKTRE